MTRFLTLAELLDLHQRLIEQAGGAPGVWNPAALDAALLQPRQTFGGEELYPTVVDKAAALCCSLVQGHPFVDGNKRIGHAAMETFLVLNGYEIVASVAEQEQVVLRLASGGLDREEFAAWLRQQAVRRAPQDQDRPSPSADDPERPDAA